jgi:cell division inhibitor SepF
MGAMYRLKAYFGMVPAEELDEYTDGPEHDRYAAPRRSREYAEDGWDERFSYETSNDRYDEWDRRPQRPMPVERAVPSAREQVRSGGLGPAPVRGSLAIDPDAVDREFSQRERPVREPAQPPAVPEQRERPQSGPAALARITTLQPRSYNEARTIGERYREGVPVIMNLTELDDAAAKRLVDFAAGLVFALRGGFDKVTNRVFLLTPADVEVSADDARRLAERSASRVEAGRVDADRGNFRQD